VTLPDGKTIKCEELYEDYPIRMNKYEFLAYLYKFELTDFGVILGGELVSKVSGSIRLPKIKNHP